MPSAKIIHSLGLLFLLVCSFACSRSPDQEEDDPGPVRISWPSRDRQGASDALPQPFEMREQSFVGSGRFNSIFWLDFEGATVSATDSFIVQDAGLKRVQIPPFMPADIGSNEERESLKLRIVQELLPLFPDIDIKLTTSRPIADVFNRVHIGGPNFTGRPRVAGIAPLDQGNLSGQDRIFVFPQELRDQGNVSTVTTEVAHVIAHEIAHSLGAQHIDNNRALMKPSVAIEADSFDQTGPVVGAANQSENSLQVLLSTAGSHRAALAEKGLPQILDLDAFASGGVIQYTVLTRRNFVSNPTLNLKDFRYIWSFEGQRAEGPSLLMSFPDKNDHILNLTVFADDGSSRSFAFSVGHRR